ncbi:MAG: hypothetical protein F6K09_05705 [Merismopedia sp. SIO2A8]|nr:hypothetical protein [Symploca sp. SIO2B6]NET48211.1 hypothetical protein [Merismopedia sp. SIO2A8]
MASSDRTTTIILAIPIIGLVYCGLVFGALLAFPILRDHAPLVAAIAVLLPLIIGVSIWIKPSVKRKDN